MNASLLSRGFRKILVIFLLNLTKCTDFVCSISLCTSIIRSCVRFVISDRHGMGKSLFVKNLAENLRFNLQCSDNSLHAVVPLHGPVVTSDTVLELLKDYAKNPTCCIYHFDIAPNVSYI